MYFSYAYAPPKKKKPTPLDLVLIWSSSNIPGISGKFFEYGKLLRIDGDKAIVQLTDEAGNPLVGWEDLPKTVPYASLSLFNGEKT